jgi:transposase-like protein
MKNKTPKDRNIYAIHAWNKKGGPHRDQKWQSKNRKRGKVKVDTCE